MRKRIAIAVIFFAAPFTPQTHAQVYDTNGVVVQTFAGSGFYGYLDGVGQQTMFYNPTAVTPYGNGRLLVWDDGNRRVRSITADGTVGTFAGGGTQSTGVGTNVSFPYACQTMIVDHSNRIWLATSPYLYLINDTYVSYRTLPGIGYSSGLCVDSSDNLYYSDTGGCKIYRYTPTNSALVVFAGSGNYGTADGNGVFTSFANPTVMAADGADNIYVWDSGSSLIRRINQNRDVATIAGRNTSDVDGQGTDASFSGIGAMCVDDSGNLILACGSSIRKISATTNVTTLAGSFTSGGYTNGPVDLARFQGASGICVLRGMIFVADRGNQRIRQISLNPPTELVSPTNLQLATFPGLQIAGAVGRTYRIEASQDMNTWGTVATVLLTSSPYLWIDQNPVAGNKFYRAFLLP